MAGNSTATLQTRLTPAQKRVVQQAAKLRNLAVSDYLRQVLVQMAEREVASAQKNIIELTPPEQMAFWNALHAPVRLTAAQRRLGRKMRAHA